MISWQIIAVAVIILAAAVYVGRLAWNHIRAFRKGSTGSACTTGCGNCPIEKPTVAPSKQIIQLTRPNSQSRRLS